MDTTNRFTRKNIYITLLQNASCIMLPECSWNMYYLRIMINSMGLESLVVRLQCSRMWQHIFL